MSGCSIWVVAYLLVLVQHHAGQHICDKIWQKCNLVDSAEEAKDNIEQEQLQHFMLAPVPIPVTSPAPDMDQYFNDLDLDIERLDDDDGEGDDDGENDDELEMVDETETFTGEPEGEDSDPAFLTSPKTRMVHSNGVTSGGR